MFIVELSLRSASCSELGRAAPGPRASTRWQLWGSGPELQADAPLSCLGAALSHHVWPVPSPFPPTLYDGLRGKRASPEGRARRWSPARDLCPPWGSPCPGRSARTRRAALPRLTGLPVGHAGSTPEAFSRLEGENFTKYSKRKTVFVGRPGLQKPLSGNVRRGPATVPLRPRLLEQLPAA